MKDYLLTLTEIKALSEKVFLLKLDAKEDLPEISAGQFLHIEVPGFTLRRPFCIYDFDARTVSIVFAIAGKGTKTLSRLNIGTVLKCILPIGNGFFLKNEHKMIMLIGGGLGVAPLFPILKNYPNKEYFAFLGFGDSDCRYIVEDFHNKTKNTFVATANGSIGTKGLVSDLFKLNTANKEITILHNQQAFKPDIILACGPEPMLKYLKGIDFACPVLVSTEARMGCGVGACLVCTCPVKKGEAVKNLRVCIDGPVFKLDELFN